MSAPTPSPAVPVEPKNYLNCETGIKSWLLTRDHKRIALLYLAAVTFFFFVGGAMAVLIRLELATPVGDLVTDETVRSRGYGSRMIERFREEARTLGCNEIQLISRTIREQAHRFYFREGFGIECFHFRLPLDRA